MELPRIPFYRRSKKSLTSKYQKIRKLQLEVSKIMGIDSKTEEKFCRLALILKRSNEKYHFLYKNSSKVSIQSDNPQIESYVLLFNFASLLYDKIQQFGIDYSDNYMVNDNYFQKIISILCYIKNNETNPLFEASSFFYFLICGIYYEFKAIFAKNGKHSLYKEAEILLREAKSIREVPNLTEKIRYYKIKAYIEYAVDSMENLALPQAEKVLKKAKEVFEKSSDSFKANYRSLKLEIKKKYSELPVFKVSKYYDENIKPIRDISPAEFLPTLYKSIDLTKYESIKRNDVYSLKLSIEKAKYTNFEFVSSISRLLTFNEKLERIRKKKNAKLYSGCFPEKSDVLDVKSIEKTEEEVQRFISFVESTSLFLKNIAVTSQRLDDISDKIDDDLVPQIEALRDDEADYYIKNYQAEIKSNTITDLMIEDLKNLIVSVVYQISLNE